jgi:hypothetical protein
MLHGWPHAGPKSGSDRRLYLGGIAVARYCTRAPDSHAAAMKTPWLFLRAAKRGSKIPENPFGIAGGSQLRLVASVSGLGRHGVCHVHAVGIR